MAKCSACVPHLTFRLSNVHVDELWALHTEKVNAAFCGHGLCNQGLPCAYTSTAQPFHTSISNCTAACLGHVTKSDQTDCQTGRQERAYMYVYTDRRTDRQIDLTDKNRQTVQADMQADRPTQTEC